MITCVDSDPNLQRYRWHMFNFKTETPINEFQRDQADLFRVIIIPFW